jgi:GAF domain-containing protein
MDANGTTQIVIEEFVSVPKQLLERLIQAARHTIDSGSADIYYDRSNDGYCDESERDDDDGDGKSITTLGVELHDANLTELSQALDALGGYLIAQSEEPQWDGVCRCDSDGDNPCVCN